MSKTREETNLNSDEIVVDFIQNAREHGIDHATIRHMLMSRGWKNREICQQIADVELGQPIPASHGHGGPREAFYFFSAFACLYVSVVALIVMLFNLVDIGFLDPGADDYQEEFLYETVHSALSTLIVFFPLFWVFNWLIRRETRSGKLVAGGEVERWLTYLTFLLVVMTVLIDAANLIYWLLEGELSTSLGLKAFILFAVMGAVYVLFRLSNTTSIADDQNVSTTRATLE